MTNSGPGQVAQFIGVSSYTPKNCGFNPLWVRAHMGGNQLTFLSHIHVSLSFSLILSFLKRSYLFLERGEGKKKKRERNINLWLPLEYPLLGDLTDNPGMHPDWELNQRPFGL